MSPAPCPCGSAPSPRHRPKCPVLHRRRERRQDGDIERRATPGSYDTGSLITFLEGLHEHFADAKVTLIRDNLPSHKSRAMTAWLATQARWLRAERLPGYAHDLNPIELVWGNIKTVEPANLCPDTLDEARDAAEAGLKRVSSNSQLCFAFLAHTGLSL